MTGSSSEVAAAPAKINVTLDVGPLRPDGFHEVDSVVLVLAAPADRVTVDVSAGGAGVRLTCDSRGENPCPLPTDARNLAFRAAAAFVDRFGLSETASVRLHLEKTLPSEAGLGGGSSDAAAVLRALARLLPAAGAQRPEALLPIAAAIGADVSLFVVGDAGALVRMRGRGEIVEPLSHAAPPPALHGVLVRPDVGVPTGPAYALLDALPDRRPATRPPATPRLLDALASGADAAVLAAAMHNDFEAAVLPAFPPVAAAHAAVRGAGALRALLCGSGSAVFGLARDRDHADTLARSLRGRFPWVAVATTVGEAADV